MPERYRCLIVLGAGSGIRVAEALGVTSDRIDWPRLTIKVDRQLLRVSGEAPVFGPVKDKKNRPRTIPLSDEVMAALVEHVRTFGLGPKDLIVTNDNSEPIRRSTFADIWARVARPLGMEVGEGFHQLRHFYASVLIHGGADIVLVQKMLGHASLETTQIYSHLFPNSADTVRAAVDRAMRSLKSAPKRSKRR
jgi:integrase